MQEFANERENLIKKILEAELREKAIVEKAFIPWDKQARPFKEQKSFFRDSARTKLCLTGNRAAKTFSTLRDLSWKLMRNHPFRSEWRMDYEESKKAPKKMWVCAPTFEFIKEVAWDEYIKRFIPRWYYTNDDGEEMIVKARKDGYEFVERVYFRNGDVLEFKSYMQNILTKMGRAVDVVVLDEMPPKLMVITELVTRVLDKGGELVMGFTPLNPDPAIKEYLENHPRLATHTWPLLSNPLYGKDPEKYARVLDEYNHLPINEKNARLNGEWYYELSDDENIFADVFPEVIDDFDVPWEWRRMIVADPASHVTGFAIFAEDPLSEDWLCIDSGELFWRGKLATTDDILGELDRRKPYENYKYVKAIYDNAEAWFGAHAAGEWRPCMEKNKKAQIIALRNLIVNRKLKFFKHGGATALRQIAMYRSKNGKIVKRNDHVVDCLQYFAREVPPPVKKKSNDAPVTNEEIAKAHMENLKKKWASNGTETSMIHGLNTRRVFYSQGILSRRAR
jgi:phage terminase large subunit-like protein